MFARWCQIIAEQMRGHGWEGTNSNGDHENESTERSGADKDRRWGSEEAVWGKQVPPMGWPGRKQEHLLSSQVFPDSSWPSHANRLAPNPQMFSLEIGDLLRIPRIPKARLYCQFQNELSSPWTPRSLIKMQSTSELALLPLVWGGFIRPMGKWPERARVWRDNAEADMPREATTRERVKPSTDMEKSQQAAWAPTCGPVSGSSHPWGRLHSLLWKIPRFLATGASFILK